MAAGRFREDLFYRLNVIPIQVPPLRSRKEDIPLLAEHFLGRFSREMRKPVAKISSDAMTRLVQYPWPGNVRELENVIERAVALETSSAVLPERLPKEMFSAAPAASSGEPLAEGFSLDDHLRAIEADLVRRALEQSEGDRTRACSLLGISSRSLRYLLEKHRDVLAS